MSAALLIALACVWTALGVAFGLHMGRRDHERRPQPQPLHLDHELKMARHERDSAYRQLDNLRSDWRKILITNDHLRGENRELLARCYAHEHPKP